MTEERSYTTKIWRQPSSIGFSSADALSTSMDPPGEPVISTRKRPCQKIQNGSAFPELVAQNSRNPHPPDAFRIFRASSRRSAGTSTYTSFPLGCGIGLYPCSRSYSAIAICLASTPARLSVSTHRSNPPLGSPAAIISNDSMCNLTLQGTCPVSVNQDSEGPVLDFRQLSAIISRVCGHVAGALHLTSIHFVRSF